MLGRLEKIFSIVLSGKIAAPGAAWTGRLRGFPMWIGSFSSRVLKNTVHPSTKLRTNGGWIEIIGEFPFVLRLSKHERLLRHPSRRTFCV
jgi:hypothetical protein